MAAQAPFSLSDDLALAQKMADAADAITLKRYQSLDLVITTKPDNTPVTDADKAAEVAIRELLKEHRPDDGIVGEEFGEQASALQQGASRYWVIDPIDGTKNFLRGVPTWATLIGLVERQSDGSEKVIVGVVSAPALYRRWYASDGMGAFVSENGKSPKRVSVSKISDISNASISYSDFLGWGSRLVAFQTLLTKAWRTRGVGDFWSHILVAEGAVDSAIEPSLALWDMAALDIIVREAGGRFTNTDGVDGPFGGSGVSSNGALHDEIIRELNHG
jgi:histidinol-phosphatase